MSERVHRQNFAGSVAKVRPSPVGGGILLDAAVARVGVLTYSDGDRTWNELLPEEEVFAANSTDTLRGSAVTVLHPPEMVTAETWERDAVGHPTGDASRDGDFLVVPVAVQRADAVKRVSSGDLHDVSTGYTCRVEPSPGVWRGQPYDAVQRELRYNHLALLPEGDGRAGVQVSLRLNGGAVEVRAEAAPGKASMADEKTGAQTAPPAAEKANAEPEHVQKIAELEAQVTALAKALAALKAAEASEPAETVNAAVTEEMVPEAVKNSIAEKRLSLWSEASKVLGTGVRLNGLSERALKELVASKVLGDSVDVKALPAGALDGVFLTATRTNTGRGLASLGAVLAPKVTEERTNSAAPVHPFARLQDETANAWRSNTSTSARGAQKGQ